MKTSLKEILALRIATWNVNSIRQRLPLFERWLTERKPDLVFLQETKCENAHFPYDAFKDSEYAVATSGQKTFNGVAVLSRYPFESASYVLPNAPNEQARYLEVVLCVNNLTVRAASVYAPNGNPIDSPNFQYKLAFMEKFTAHVKTLLNNEEILILGGDYNILPTDKDAKNPEKWRDDAVGDPRSRRAWRTLLNTGLEDALEAVTSQRSLYTFWGYRANAWEKNDGVRIDAMLLSPQACDRLQRIGIDKSLRGLEKPSDHVPVWIDLNCETEQE